MNPNVSATPSMMLPPELLRGGQTSAGQIFPQNPLSQGMSPSAMGADPTTMQQPQPGSAAGNPTMPGATPPPMAGTSQPNGQPDAQQPQMSEAEYILHVLGDRLKHHSSITLKTVNALSDMIAAQMPTPDQGQQPTA